ncbi:MAG: hypothetical protein K2J13_03010, partial [Clostridia bacterium]|nr:hypothetical protein [Clostridia bacterium]
MKGQMTKMKKLITVCLLILLCLGFGVCFAVSNDISDNDIAYAAQENATTKSRTEQIGVEAYKLEDNTGYKESAGRIVRWFSRPLRKRL